MQFPILLKYLSKLPPRIAGWLENKLIKSPIIDNTIEKEHKKIIPKLEQILKPYINIFKTHTTIPASGLSKIEILEDMKKISSLEKKPWKEGYVSGAVYHGNDKHISFLNDVYSLQSQSNPLHSDLFPSASKFESEIVSMTANMLGADKTDDEICGVVTSGGTESILLAMKTYRDRANEINGIHLPNIIMPTTAHAAFDKAGEYFKIEIIRIPINDNSQIDISKVDKAINKNTIAIIGSAPNFPHGTIDPIKKMADIAQKHNLGMHVDACLGGFVLPWAKKLGYPIPNFDFQIPGVTSISVDTHKFGYAAKGTSVILYRTPQLRHYQYYTIADWPGGLYFSSTFSGSRPGALIACCWAAMLVMGENGYLESVRSILNTAEKIKTHLQEIKGLKLIGDPLWVISFTSSEFDIYELMMSR